MVSVFITEFMFCERETERESINKEEKLYLFTFILLYALRMLLFLERKKEEA